MTSENGQWPCLRFIAIVVVLSRGTHSFCHQRHPLKRLNVPRSSQEVASPSSLLYAEPSTSTRRDFLVGGALVTTAATVLLAPSSSAQALDYTKNPVNKRYGVTVQDAEAAGYNVGFITYLTRFLLNFDRDIQQYWISSTSSSSKPTELFGELAASVEVKLLDYRDPQGSSRLLSDLVQRYCPPVTENTPKRTRREIKEARRQLALLFALLQDIQPVRDLTQLLGQVDNASVTRTDVRLLESSPLTWNPESSAIVLGPPAVGEARAQATPILKTRLSNIRILDGGSGYGSDDTPIVTVNGGALDSSNAKAVVKNGKVTQIVISSQENLDDNMTYPGNPIVTITPPAAPDGRTATAEATVTQCVAGVSITDPGAGYVTERPVKIYLASTKYTDASADELKKLLDTKKITLLGEVSAASETSSYSSFRKEDDENSEKKAVSGVSASSSGTDDGLPALPFWNPKSTSTSFLRLLPAGVGVEYDSKLKRYTLVVDQATEKAFPTVSRRPLGPEFGPRGRAPVERDAELTANTLIRFAASGAVCASGVHLALTPLDVVKTKVQTNPTRYPTVPGSFRTILDDGGLSTFYTGWLPTLLGNLASGAAVYTLTEFVRRSLSEQAGPLALTYEVPIILAAAAVASTLGSVLSCPFETLRIRQVAKPDYGPNTLAVFQRILSEEGWISLVNAIPVLLLKNIPYAMTKFTVFDLTTEHLYDVFPSATENLKLSLLISLVGGCLGGTAAAVVSNPADALISELKKAKSDISPQEAAAAMWERGSFGAFFKGLPVRLVYYSLIASLQFLVYDGVRFALGIGPDDLKLYLDVLGGALSETGGPV